MLGEEVADIADGLAEGIAGSGGGLSEFGGSENAEGEQKTVRGTGFSRTGIIFPTQDVAATQGRDELGLDMEIEQVAVDPSPWSLGPVALPWLDVDDPRRYADLRFIEEDQPFRHVAQFKRQAIDPGDQSWQRTADVGPARGTAPSPHQAARFRWQTTFYLWLRPGRCSQLPTEARCTQRSWAAA